MNKNDRKKAEDKLCLYEITNSYNMTEADFMKETSTKDLLTAAKLVRADLQMYRVKNLKDEALLSKLSKAESNYTFDEYAGQPLLGK